MKVFLTHEKVVCVRVRPSDLEKLHQVVELSVDIATDCDWAFLQVLLEIED